MQPLRQRVYDTVGLLLRVPKYFAAVVGSVGGEAFAEVGHATSLPRR